MTEPIVLPGCPTPIAPLGVGTWAWGDKSTWGMGGYDSTISETTIAEAWDSSIEAGITLFDTAEVYGGGESERIIGRMLRRDPSRRERLVLATKFMPLPWKLDVERALIDAAKKSVERMGIETIDLYQLHGPVSLRSKAALAEALAAAQQAGLVRAVGVSNYSAAEMERIHGELAKRGLPLASNQIELSLLRRRPETSGLLAACERLGVVPLAYSPIGQGRLTGKYSASNPPPGNRSFSAHPMEKVDAVVAVLREVGEAHDRTPSQVALQWLVAKGSVPIPGAKNAKQATDNAGGVGWTLRDHEVSRLDAVALEGTHTLQSRFWQHG